MGTARGFRVLVVDDDALQLELIARSLSRDGFEVACVSTPAKLADEVRRFVPEVVLLDVNMPGGTGGLALELARKVAPQGARLLLFSASDESTLRSLATKFQADGWVSKSWSSGDIARRLQRVGAEARAAATTRSDESPPRSR